MGPLRLRKTRMPLLVVSPFAKRNYVDHTLTDQTSVLCFIEDNWLAGERIQPGGSFDTIAGTPNNMFGGWLARAKPVFHFRGSTVVFVDPSGAGCIPGGL